MLFESDSSSSSEDDDLDLSDPESTNQVAFDACEEEQSDDRCVGVTESSSYLASTWCSSIRDQFQSLYFIFSKNGYFTEE